MDLCSFTIGRVPPGVQVLRVIASRAARPISATGASTPVQRVRAWAAWCTSIPTPSTVRAPGEFAVRGGLIDVFPPGAVEPFRFDFFGDTLETIRSFDPETQRTTDQLRALNLVPVSEFQLTTETIRRFGKTVELHAGDEGA